MDLTIEIHKKKRCCHCCGNVANQGPGKVFIYQDITSTLHLALRSHVKTAILTAIPFLLLTAQKLFHKKY